MLAFIDFGYIEALLLFGWSRHRLRKVRIGIPVNFLVVTRNGSQTNDVEVIVVLIKVVLAKHYFWLSLYIFELSFFAVGFYASLDLLLRFVIFLNKQKLTKDMSFIELKYSFISETILK